VTLYEIDLDATRRRVEAVTADGLRALGEVRQRSVDIDRTVDEMFERQAREKQAMDEQVKLATTKEEQPEAERPRPKRTLKLGADEDRGQERDKPVRKRPPRPEGDDDMSGRTWLR
jgi:hypothetical protein